jgi:hypothetical protein
MHLVSQGTRVMEIELSLTRNPNEQGMEILNRVKRHFSNETIVWPHKLSRLSSSNKLSMQSHFS